MAGCLPSFRKKRKPEPPPAEDKADKEGEGEKKEDQDGGENADADTKPENEEKKSEEEPEPSAAVTKQESKSDEAGEKESGSKESDESKSESSEDEEKSGEDGDESSSRPETPEKQPSKAASSRSATSVSHRSSVSHESKPSGNSDISSESSPSRRSSASSVVELAASAHAVEEKPIASPPQPNPLEEQVRVLTQERDEAVRLHAQATAELEESRRENETLRKEIEEEKEKVKSLESELSSATAALASQSTRPDHGGAEDANVDSGAAKASEDAGAETKAAPPASPLCVSRLSSKASSASPPPETEPAEAVARTFSSDPLAVAALPAASVATEEELKKVTAERDSLAKQLEEAAVFYNSHIQRVTDIYNRVVARAHAAEKKKNKYAEKLAELMTARALGAEVRAGETQPEPVPARVETGEVEALRVQKQELEDRVGALVDRCHLLQQELANAQRLASPPLSKPLSRRSTIQPARQISKQASLIPSSRIESDSVGQSLEPSDRVFSSNFGDAKFLTERVEREQERAERQGPRESVFEYPKLLFEDEPPAEAEQAHVSTQITPSLPARKASEHAIRSLEPSDRGLSSGYGNAKFLTERMEREQERAEKRGPRESMMEYPRLLFSPEDESGGNSPPAEQAQPSRQTTLVPASRKSSELFMRPLDPADRGLSSGCSNASFLMERSEREQERAERQGLRDSVVEYPKFMFHEEGEPESGTQAGGPAARRGTSRVTFSVLSGSGGQPSPKQSIVSLPTNMFGDADANQNSQSPGMRPVSDEGQKRAVDLSALDGTLSDKGIESFLSQEDNDDDNSILSSFSRDIGAGSPQKKGRAFPSGEAPVLVTAQCCGKQVKKTDLRLLEKCGCSVCRHCLKQASITAKEDIRNFMGSDPMSGGPQWKIHCPKCSRPQIVSSTKTRAFSFAHDLK
ncbi:hypothetical protein BESB_080570 [Besnoitia besnoiti]|uniref:Uncharacterized protein n=1 Tax=Besnoitia besnoiti TaxID=94643 RepID=A0A2A9MBZ1_BESBE|nr:hypothetical protein BESB_080570 [Besnoitia besnoiti]PFH33841.1 hypothetical protein BESB_080570 [Besnoitia besnoiti]